MQWAGEGSGFTPGGALEQESRVMSPLHLPGLYLSVWQEDRLKDGKQTAILNDGQALRLVRQTGR